MNARVGCVVLAAGQSRRLGGEPKLLLPFAGKPLLQHAIDAAAQSSAASCTLVVGAHADEILRSVDTRRCAVLANGDWQEGIASSIRAGLTQHINDDACIFLVADQPLVTTQDLNRLIQEFLGRRTAIVVLRSGDIWGTPALFSRSDFAALKKLRGDSGAKPYAQRHRDRIVFVQAARPNAFSDVDTAEDYEHLTKS